MKPRPDTIEILGRLRRGDRAAYDELLPHLYDELRRLARRELRRERTGHTLQPTALVHEAYLRLAGGQAADLRDRAHFVVVAARAMRHVLVDHARARRRRKRGGAGPAPLRLSLAEIPAARGVEPIDLVALDLAIDRLGAIDPRKASVVELLYFGGLTAAEAGRVLRRTARTIERDWAFARAWLLREMSGCSRPDRSSSGPGSGRRGRARPASVTPARGTGPCRSSSGRCSTRARAFRSGWSCRRRRRCPP